ncbi:hypothetical protein H9Q69_012716 [Fusarium xylarioides]|uniref:Uncharacterized protein n=1 Tax=Fusarium xylarioides TaxID=221167 RepID=A0A9P7IMW9_9HYPO|nr:hypothetical protein H9Q70_010635 [Fusarium xylarioides]KAG5761685.1 hypothetical protein H9Q72_010202 [Fusarium xylarioides]KAG5775140.1 hypothetical protein H9Q73_011187 [Fusarium xylarioides]KAG5788221.1 hypothetical protein H9Q69_012716 [Fusarium xylarioides]KAG5806842.1 hypothetical protein H9Q71_008587 [Fusarium xylarioides]
MSRPETPSETTLFYFFWNQISKVKMMQDNKSETEQEVQETGQTLHHHQQPSLKDTGSGSPRSQNEPYFDDSTTSTKPTRTQVARETTETYNNYRNKRKTKDPNWWGSKQHEAERGDPDREFQFARNMPVSSHDIKSAQQAYNARITDPATGMPDPLGPHLRPTTPPMEKAEKQIKGLEDQGVSVTPRLREEVSHHYISNNGLHAALLIWCRNKKDVPVQYVNEYIKSMSRLKLEMATQQRDVTEKLGQAIKDCEEKESRCQKLKAENGKLNMEIQRLKEAKEKTYIQASPLVTTQHVPQAHIEDYSMQYNEHSIPPPATVQLPGAPLTSVGEASESSQSSPLSAVAKESLEKKPWSVKAAKSNATQDDACRNRVKELEVQLQDLKEDLRASKDGIRVQGKPNYTTVDSLINAVRKENQGLDGDDEAPNLVDRINYLNLVCFFRTRNYLQLALREGDHTLAKILLNDADKWVKSCKEYFETMDPEVNLQIEGSMLILHGMRQVLTTKDEGVLIEGVKYVTHGRNELSKLPKSDSFAQLVQLADSILHATKYEEKQDSLGIKGLPFNPFRRKNKSQYTKIQGTIKDDPAMKAEALRLTGVHSPLSPQKWRKDN